MGGGALHDADNLQRERVLPQVVAALEHHVEVLAARVGVEENEPERHLLRRHALALVHLEAAALEARVERQLEARREGDLPQLTLQLRHALRLGERLDELRRPDELLLHLALQLHRRAVGAAAAQILLEIEALPRAATARCQPAVGQRWAQRGWRAGSGRAAGGRRACGLGTRAGVTKR